MKMESKINRMHEGKFVYFFFSKCVWKCEKDLKRVILISLKSKLLFTGPRVYLVKAIFTEHLTFLGYFIVLLSVFPCSN